MRPHKKDKSKRPTELRHAKAYRTLLRNIKERRKDHSKSTRFVQWNEREGDGSFHVITDTHGRNQWKAPTFGEFLGQFFRD